MKITSLTSIYKGAKHIKGFLRDIKDQTFFNETEWFFLNCGSPENEYEYIKPYLKYPNIKYEEIDEVISVYGAWNYMINNSESEYIITSNLDDRRFPTHLETHSDTLDFNDHYDLAYAYSLITNQENDSYENYTQSQPVRVYPNGPFDRNNLINHCYPGQSPMYRRSLHIEYGMFDDKLRSAGDLEFWLRCIKGGCQDFVLIPEILGIYLMNPQGLSTSTENSEWRSREEQYVKEKYR